VVQKVQIN